jgi:DNA-binding transcriptional MocR family regulator
VELFERAAQEKITIAPGPIFSPSGRYRNFMRLSCGNPWTDRIERAIARLGHLVERMSQGY